MLMSKDTIALTDLNPKIREFQAQLRTKYATENLEVIKGQTVFVGSSLMEIFPIEKMQVEQDLGLPTHIYNRGVRATTTADLLANLDTLIFALEPSKIFINIGSNDIGFAVAEDVFLANYTEILAAIKTRLPKSQVYLMAYYPINTEADFAGMTQKAHLYEHRSNQLLNEASLKVKKLAKKFNYNFINANAGLTDANGNLKAEYTFDGAHMLPVAYQIVFNNLKKYLF